jgi:hypothetical protein
VLASGECGAAWRTPRNHTYQIYITSKYKAIVPVNQDPRGQIRLGLAAYVPPARLPGSGPARQSLARVSPSLVRIS